MKKITKKKMTLDNLAILMAGSFSGLEERLTKKIYGVEEKLTKKIDSVENKFEGVNKRIDDFAVTRVKYEDHNKLKSRMDLIESKVK